MPFDIRMTFYERQLNVRGPLFDGRGTLMEDNFQWKIIFDGRQYLKKTKFIARQPFMEDDFMMEGNL